ncbi:CMRF35-like molecule 5 [Pezoporus wallicus]|uniref:CMRF35-like molecule 5 n=1 Tax=Pezoporus wallicus TaxID=35540 RepID=UPI002551B8AA|nr:CMRF35-like molecule 5 [Pezoporus wallicus]
MWIFLLWILFPGGWAVTGPTQVMVNQGSSVAVSCSYEPGYELYSKFWCQRGFLGLCTCVIQTNGSEVTVTQDRVSIKDNHASHSFTVTLDHVTLEDAGWYSCGVKRKIFSLKHSTKVIVSKATAKGSDVSPLVTTAFGDPPVLSQLSITYLLLILCIKVPMVLLLVCVAVWGRSQCRSRGQEILQLRGSWFCASKKQALE